MSTAQTQFPVDKLPQTDISKAFQNNENEKIWSGPFTFVAGADTQFGLIDRYILKKEEPNWDKEIALTQSAIQALNEMKPKPKFFVICGDMLDSFPGPDENLLALRERQYVDFVHVFKNLDPEIKLVCICGNHDVGDEPTEEMVKVYRRQFGPDFFSFWVSGVKFVVLNSQYFKAPGFVPKETADQLKFMETIADGDAKHIVVFQHIPFFVEHPDEDGTYFNIDKGLRLDLLDKLKSAGVRYIFCGHLHRNAGAFYNGMEDVVTSAIGAQLGNDKSGFRIVTVSHDKITHEYVNLE